MGVMAPARALIQPMMAITSRGALTCGGIDCWICSTIRMTRLPYREDYEGDEQDRPERGGHEQVKRVTEDFHGRLREMPVGSQDGGVLP